LCHIARVVEGALRAGDWCARWGGEEFLLFIADSDAEAGMLAVERVRRALLENPPPAAGGELSATMSFGVAVSTDHQKYQDMIAEADLLLYESKRRGRNRISVRQDSAGPALWKREQIEKALAAGLLCARCVAVRDCQTDGIAALYAAPFLRGGGDGILRAARMARSAEIQGVLPEVDIAFLEAARRDLADAPAPVLIPLAAKTLAQNTAAAAVIRYVEDGKPPMVIGASALSAADDDALRNLRVIAAHGAPIFLDDVPPASPPFSVIAAAPFSFILFSNRRRRRADATTKTEAAAAAPPARLDSLLRAAFTAVAEGGATKTILAADAQEAKSVAANLYRPPDNPAALEDILKPDKDKK
jgi:predicted signal transduction protein with EAL and GGDEF domain